MSARTNVVSVVVAVLLASSFASSSRAAGVTPGQETPVQRHQAEQKFLRGKQLYNEKKYDEALVELRASLDIVQSPNTRLLIARCLRDKGDLVRAYVEFGRAAVAAKELASVDARYAAAAKGAQDDRAALEEKIGFVSVTVQNATDDSKLIIGGEEIRRAAWGEPTPVAPGSTDVIVETPGRPPAKKTVKVAPKERQAVTIDAAAGDASAPVVPAKSQTEASTTPATPVNRASLRTYSYVAGGVGVVGLLVFTIFGLQANSSASDLRSSCPNGACPPSKADEISSGKTQQTIANVGLVFGVLGAAAGATLFVLSMPKKEEPPRAAIVVAPAWIGVRGSL